MNVFMSPAVREMLARKTINQAIRPVLMFSVVAGVHPRHRKIGVTAALCFYCFLVWLFIGYGTMGSFLWLQNIDFLLYDSLMHLALQKVQKAFRFSNYSVILICTFVYHKPFYDVLRELRIVEKSFADLRFKFEYDLRKPLINILLKMVIYIPVLCLDITLSTSNPQWLFTFTKLVSVYGPLIPIFAYELQFYAVLIFIGDHFSFINDRLKESVENLPIQEALNKVYKLLSIYDDLRELSIKINKMNASAILITVPCIVFLGIVNFHLIGIAGPYKRVPLFTQLFGAIILRLFELWNVLQPYVRITELVEEFNSTLFKWIIHDKTGILKKQEKLYIHISTRREISFTAMGIFPLDQSILHAALAAAATLLVILIQYSLSKTKLWCE